MILLFGDYILIELFLFHTEIILFHTESTEITELPVLWQYFTLSLESTELSLGASPATGCAVLAPMVLRSHCASRHDEVYDKICGFKFFCVHFLLIRIRVNLCVFCEFCVRLS